MSGIHALIHAVVYTGDAVWTDRAVLISDGKVKGLVTRDEVPPEASVTSLEGKILAPGFIDVQVNGGGGVLFNADPTPEALRTIAAAHQRFGTLHWCPTVISTDRETMERGLRAVREVVDGGIGVLGAHLEGPYLSHARPGVHDKSCIRLATDDEIDLLLDIGHIALVTAAPESVTKHHIGRFTQAGARVFIGHSGAACGETLAMFTAGACGVTHLYNAMSQLAGREPGVVGASFLTDTWAGIIADGIHTDWRSIQIAKNIKKNRLFLVTDAMPPVGKPDAVYTIGGMEVVCREGRCATADGTLAGSALDMASAVRNAVTYADIPLDEALRMASAYLAQMLGVDDRLGYIRPGYAADLVVMDEGLTVAGILRNGEWQGMA